MFKEVVASTMSQSSAYPIAMILVTYATCFIGAFVLMRYMMGTDLSLRQKVTGGIIVTICVAIGVTTFFLGLDSLGGISREERETQTLNTGTFTYAIPGSVIIVVMGTLGLTTGMKHPKRGSKLRS